MLKKLFYYDMKALSRVMLPATLILILSTVLGAVSLRYNLVWIEGVSKPWQGIISVIAINVTIISIVGIVGFYILTAVMVFRNYYCTMFQDQGYLTFTLPVGEGQILSSKILSGFLWTLISMLTSISCGFLMALVGSAEGSLASSPVLRGIQELYQSFDLLLGESPVFYLVIVPIFLLASSFFTLILLYLAITLASILVKKARVILAIALYYVCNSVVSVAQTIISAVVSAFVEEAKQTPIMLVIFTGTFIVFGIIGFFINRYLLKNKYYIN